MIRAASDVRGDSLRAMIEFLTVDPATGRPRSRFTFREAELGEVADSLSARLARYTGAPVQRTVFSVTDDRYSPDTFRTENIMARLPGLGTDSATVVICAHYDAIGVRTEGWEENWETLPAPGADDNGTGVAALLEAARVLSAYELPFDLLFVLFSAEELGKLGSIDFAGRCDSLCAARIRAVINIDMIGYRERGDPAGSILSDYSSGWIADMIVREAALVDPGLTMRVVKPGPSNWDHASFWEHSTDGRSQHIAAVTLAEPLYGGGFITYPYYHTVRDTLGWVAMDQVERITRLLIAFVARFAEAPAAAAVLPSDVLLRGDDLFFGDEEFLIGERITALVRCRNVGGADAPAGSRIGLTVALENRSGIRTLYTGELDPPGPLAAVQTEVGFDAAERSAGENLLHARITVSGFDDDQRDNETTVRFVVTGGREILAGHGFSPNPVRGDFREALFCLNLTEEANVTIELYTIEGERIAGAVAGEGYGVPLAPGQSCISCGELFPAISTIASGVYLYRVVSRSAGGLVHRGSGRFAVVN